MEQRATGNTPGPPAGLPPGPPAPGARGPTPNPSVVTTGAENGLQQVAEIARRMVLRCGMSEKLGPISFVARSDEGLPPAFQLQPYSKATSETIDAEVHRIVEECHRQAETLLAEHRAELDALAKALPEVESLDEAEIRKLTPSANA